MRVLHVDAGREWRGGQHQVHLLTRELARVPDVDLRLVTKRGGELANRAAGDGVPVAGVSWGLSLDPRALFGLAAMIHRFRPDVVHAHDSHALRLSLAARRVARGRPPRIVAYRLVDYPVRPGGIWFRADRVAAVSDAVRRVLLAAGLPGERISVIPPGVDLGAVRTSAERPFLLRQLLGLPPRARVALSVGSLVDQKDYLTLIRAAVAARGASPDLHWVIAGEGRQRPTLEVEIARCDLADRIHLLGHVDRVPSLIREADVLVLSSKAEGLPNVVLEALALSRPVVATRAGGTPEILPPDALVNIGDADALAARVVRTLAHPAVTELPSRFTLPELVRAFLALYRSLV